MKNESIQNMAVSFVEIDAEQLISLQQEASRLLIDVRESHELPRLDPEVFVNIPMSQFHAFLQTEVTAEHLVLICQHGIRSVAAAEALYEKYGAVKKIYSLKGGIVKWSASLLEAKLSQEPS